MSALNIIDNLERIKNNYKKLLEIFPNDSTLELYYKKVSKSIDNLKKETLKNKTSSNKIKPHLIINFFFFLLLFISLLL
jgi:hypothetical protein